MIPPAPRFRTSLPPIDRPRFEALLAGVNQFGHDPDTGGHNRPSYGEADMAARAWLVRTMDEAGLAARMDAAGNVIGRWGPSHGPCVVAGSHLDTVPDGGPLDGTLGVCAALEVVLGLRAAGWRPQLAIEIIATAEEEGRFGGMLGSQAVTATIDPAWLAAAADTHGRTLTDTLTAAGLPPQRLGDAARPAGDVLAFVELHIEQGPVLEHLDVPIGVADGISGVCELELTLTGEANHSGTTPMSLRADAFAGLAAFATAIEPMLAAHGTNESRLTIGRVVLEPGFAHTVPGVARASLVLRDPDAEVMRALRQACERVLGDVCRPRRLAHQIVERSWLDPVRLDPALADRIAAHAAKLGIGYHRMCSGAGHDAQIFQRLCPSGLIFVPSTGGVSHAPHEHTSGAHLEAGVRMLQAVLVDLAGCTAA